MRGAAVMVDDIDIFRSAAVLIKEHGGDADVIAIKRAMKMLDSDDMDGYAVWKRIMDAIKDTQRETPCPGEHQH